MKHRNTSDKDSTAGSGLVIDEWFEAKLTGGGAGDTPEDELGRGFEVKEVSFASEASNVLPVLVAVGPMTGSSSASFEGFCKSELTLGLLT